MKFQLFVIGAGGTGSYFLKEISRFLCGNDRFIDSCHIFDGDIVEEKNLTRQSFMKEDVGRNKASVMAEILNDSFSLDWAAHDVYVTSHEELKKLIKTGSKSSPILPVIISCVDNHACRLELEKLFDELPNIAYFDSGNEYTTGEVVYSYKMGGNVIGPVRSHYFPEMKEGDLRGRTELSCEELNTVSPQHIFTNMFAGNLLCSGFSNLMDEKVHPGVTFFNAASLEAAFRPYVAEKG